MCGGGSLLGAVIGGIAAYYSGGATLGMTGAAGVAAGAGAGAMVGNTVVDQPELQKKGLDAQKAANAAAMDMATKQADQADQAMNRANGKAPDLASLMGQNVLNAKGGQSGTMLTGPQGVDPNALLLGKKTLLGA